LHLSARPLRHARESSLDTRKTCSHLPKKALGIALTADRHVSLVTREKASSGLVLSRLPHSQVFTSKTSPKYQAKRHELTDWESFQSRISLELRARDREDERHSIVVPLSPLSASIHSVRFRSLRRCRQHQHKYTNHKNRSTMSEHQSTTTPPSQEPKLCKMGCGFFVSFPAASREQNSLSLAVEAAVGSRQLRRRSCHAASTNSGVPPPVCCWLTFNYHHGGDNCDTVVGAGEAKQQACYSSEKQQRANASTLVCCMANFVARLDQGKKNFSATNWKGILTAIKSTDF